MEGQIKQANTQNHILKEVSFLVWDNRVITEWHGESVGAANLYPMRPHLGTAFDKKMREVVTTCFDQNQYMYRSLMVQKKFSHELERVRTTR